ncbi:guanine nucleotide binding protein, alpha subunit [Schizophyllum amplum]|uniref:Guanine nucleotide binding protein, alpha subunit n=1 Tax=Schizophyllum amplum TaxID=97359 RepID=A0A550CWS8_9AGAR|nr:guanine nucleotide binding protein, alpha subunit [Auriculariopsis ampla]
MTRSRFSAETSADPPHWQEILAPPQNETPEQREARKQREARDASHSRRIDEELRADAAEQKKTKEAIKVLLLGQAHAGKSTVIKNLQLAYAKDEWLEERMSWKVVIQLNLARAVNTIIDAIHEELESGAETSLDNTHKMLSLKLGPLRNVQAELEAGLGSASIDDPDAQDADMFAQCDPDTMISVTPPPRDDTPSPHGEFYVNNNMRWQQALKKITPSRSPRAVEDAPPHLRKHVKALEDVTEVLAGCRDEIRTLWKDSVVKALLKSRPDIKLEDSSPFFLADVDRIATTTYEPSDDDVLRCRLRTTAVQEYSFTLAKKDWIFYDFSGSRSARAGWFSYFDDVTAVIFLAPVSVFDEVDETGTNRLRDSMSLWKTLCSEKLLMRAQLVLFLNKCDVLDHKLKSTKAQIKDYFPSFKDRSNDTKTVCKYFRTYFYEIMQQCSPKTGAAVPRTLFAHYTTAVDKKQTAYTLNAVKDAIVRDYLETAKFI